MTRTDHGRQRRGRQTGWQWARALAVAIAAVVLIPTLSYAQASPWENAVNVSESARRGKWPDTFARRTGNGVKARVVDFRSLLDGSSCSRAKRVNERLGFEVIGIERPFIGMPYDCGLARATGSTALEASSA
jgi:hypothetical protein